MRQAPSDERLVWRVSRAAGAVALLTMLALPLGFFLLAYERHVELLEQITLVKAEDIAVLASENPDLWKYQTQRMEDLLERHKGFRERQMQTVTDAAGHVLARVGKAPQPPLLHCSHPIYESGQSVGHVEVIHSLRSEVDGTLLAAVLGLMLGGGAYATLRILPLRALRRVTRDLLGQQQRFVAAVESAMDGYALLDTRGRLLEVNEALCGLSGYSRKELLGLAISDLQVEPSATEFVARVTAIRHGRLEARWKRRDGSIVDVEVTATYRPPATEEGDGEAYCFVRDITQRKASDALIWRQANFDMLTQLPNRSMFYDRLAQEIKKAHRANLQLALLFIDLDHFKEVNDTLGHDLGDLLLADAARRISACVRETDTVARLGGDEYTVLLAGIEEGETGTVERIARKILEQLDAPFHLRNETAHVTASIGITFYPGDAITIEELFKHADRAMYVAKNRGRNSYSYFTPG